MDKQFVAIKFKQLTKVSPKRQRDRKLNRTVNLNKGFFTLLWLQKINNRLIYQYCSVNLARPLQLLTET